MIQFGNDKIKEIYVGSDKIKEVYHGSDLVYQAIKDPRNWWVSTSGVKSYFDLDNTPINNFATTASTIVINGSTITKTTIKKLVFGDSYKSVTDIGSFFLRYCNALTSLDLSAFSNVTSIGSNFLFNCSALTSLDLSSFSNVTSIGTVFLRNCSKITQFKIGAVNVPTTSETGFLQSTTALTTILVPMQSVQDYKTTAPWSDHASKISAI